MENLSIREYCNDDFNEVIKLLKSNFKISDTIKELDKDGDNGFSVVASLNKKIVGYIRVDIIKDIGKNSNYYFLSYVCVNSDYQNMNVATKMLDFVFNRAKDDKVIYIELTSRSSRKAANHLYLKTGFEIRDTNVFRKEV